MHLCLRLVNASSVNLYLRQVYMYRMWPWPTATRVCAASAHPITLSSPRLSTGLRVLLAATATKMVSERVPPGPWRAKTACSLTTSWLFPLPHGRRVIEADRGRVRNDRPLQVVSKRVANAKSERFYRSGLGKKKEVGFWQVRAAATAPLPAAAAPRRRRPLTHRLCCCCWCRASGSSWRHTLCWWHSFSSS